MCENEYRMVHVCAMVLIVCCMCVCVYLCVHGTSHAMNVDVSGKHIVICMNISVRVRLGVRSHVTLGSNSLLASVVD